MSLSLAESPIAIFACGSATTGAINDRGRDDKGRHDGMTDEEIMRRLELLRVEHRDLDSAIGALVDSGVGDQLQIARLKKRKLRLRDEIAQLEDMLVPDIIA